MNKFDIVIVGGGPVGLSCAIEAKKAGYSYVILEKKYLVNSIYHFPTNMTFFSTSKNLEIGDVPFISHNEKPTRKEALEYYRRIVEAHKLNIRFNKKVEAITKEKNLFEIACSDDIIYQSNNVIIATGFYDIPSMLDVPGEHLPKVKHYYDDAHPYIGKKILVVGAANSACDVALETWSKGADVTMAVRGKSLYQKVKYWILPNIENRIKEGAIKAYFNTTISNITETTVTLNTEGGEVIIENDYVLAMTGYLPDFDFLKDIGVQLNGNDMRPEVDMHFESNVKGLFLAGVIVAGTKTSELFIENTRHHGKTIITRIKDVQKK